MSTLIEESGNRILPRIVLMACGSFSPPTLMHFRMFEIARDYFDLQGVYKVIGGIVSPTHDAYGKKGLVPGTHRCAMVKLALQTSSWIRMSDWETKQNEWTRTLSVLQYHQNSMNNHIKSTEHNTNANEILPSWLPKNLANTCDPVQLRLLCGADLLESFAVPGLWADEDIEEIIGNHGLVVISRSGANPEKFIFESDILTKYQHNITLVTNWVSNDVSSTMIRRLLGRGMSVKYLIDDLVLEYIKKHQLFNWKSKNITLGLKRMLPPAHLVYNAEYMKTVYLKVSSSTSADSIASGNNNKAAGNKSNASSLAATPIEDDVNDDEDVERMDETDFSMKNILNSFNLHNHTKPVSKVFCCSDGDKMGTKLLVNRNSPGQAVKVITTERATISSEANRERVREAEELKPKKMKITAPQNV